jgi:hypothetical protein
MSRNYPQQQVVPQPWQGWDEVSDYRRRYGTPQEPTIRGRTAIMLGHIYTGIGATMIAGGIILTLVTLGLAFDYNLNLYALLGLLLLIVFLVSVGYRTWYRSSLDEWAMEHDRMKWDELEEDLEMAQMQLETMAADHARELKERDEQYARLQAEHQEAVTRINALQQTLASGVRHKNASYVRKETPTQQAARAIAEAYRADRPFTRQAICADGRISQDAWRDAMALFQRHMLAGQSTKGGPWRITAQSADSLLAAAGIAPGTYVASDEEE